MIENKSNLFEEKLLELQIQSGETTWHVIAKNDHVEIIREGFFDLDKAEINVKNKAGYTALAIAIAKNNLEMVKELIKNGAKDSPQYTFRYLETYIEKNNLEMFKGLINHGDKDSLVDTFRYLEIAIERKNPKMIKELIKYGLKDSLEDTIKFLESAIEKNNLEMIKELINNAVQIPKENMLKLVNISIKNQDNNIPSFLISVFNRNYNSMGSIPSCDPSPFKRMRLSDSSGKDL